MLNNYRDSILSLLLFFLPFFAVATPLTNALLLNGDTTIMNVDMQEVQDLEGIIVDDGGFDANYADNQNRSLRLENPDVEAYRIDFLEFQTEECCDQLSITGLKNGEEIFFETFRGIVGNVQLEIPADEVIINFFADNSSNDAGFVLQFTGLVPGIPEAAFKTPNIVPCSAEILLEDLSTGFPTSWTWFLDGTEISTEQNPIITLPGIGIYDVELIACNNFGCDTLLIENYIEYSGVGIFCDTFFLINQQTQTQSICQGVIVDDGGTNGNHLPFTNSIFTINVPDSEGYILDFKKFQTQSCCSVLEIFVDRGIGYEFYQSITGNLTGEKFIIEGFRVELNWVSFGDLTDEGFVINWECQFPTLPQSDFSTANTVICNNLLELKDESIGFPDSWNWILDGVSVSTEQNPVLYIQDEGTYDVALVTCNSLGCDTLLKENFVEQLAIPFCDTLIMTSNNFTEYTSCQGVIYDQGGPDGDFEIFTGQTLRINAGGGDGIRITIKTLSLGNGFLEIYAPNVGDFFKQFNGDTSNIVMDVPADIIEFNLWTNDIAAPGFEITYECIEAELPTAFFELDYFSVCSENVKTINTSTGLPTTFTWKVNDEIFSEQSELEFALIKGEPTTISLTACNDIGCNTYTYPSTLLFDPSDALCSTIQLVNEVTQFSESCQGTLNYNADNSGSNSQSDFASIIVDNPGVQGYLLKFDNFDLGANDIIFLYAGDEFSPEFIGTYDGNLTGDSLFTFGSRFIVEKIGDSNPSELSISWACKTEGILPQLNPEITNGCTGNFEFFANANGADEISWDFGDGSGSTDDFTFHSYAAPGNYTVTLTASNAAGTTTETFDIEVLFVATAFDAPDTVLINTNNFIILSNHTAQDIQSNEWILDGNFIGTGNSVVLNLALNKDYLLSCITIDTEDCFSQFEKTIHAALVLGDQAITHDLGITIFPNPTRDVLNLTGLNQLEDRTNLILRNAMGQVLMEKIIPLGQNQFTLDLMEWNNGVFFVELIQGGEMILLEKVIKM